MSRKRRMFDIELPEDAGDTFLAGKVERPRRGPMAAAITETAESARDRAGIAAAIRDENEALAREHVRLKQAGLITDLIPLDAIDTSRLIRDRAPGPDMELAELVASIRDIGLSNPIRVEQSADGRYELIQGWRRLSAYRALLDETGDTDRWGTIPAGIIARGAALEDLYRRMVDENLVRKDISFGEMAQLAVHYAMDPLTAEQDADKAVATLFRSAGYQKRSYIRKFIPIVEQLGDTLQFLHEVPRAGAGAGRKARGHARHRRRDPRRSGRLGQPFGQGRAGHPAPLCGRGGQGGDARSAATVRTPVEPAATARARTTFQLARPQGNAKCIAANGRLEIRLARDFTSIDRRRLEAAVASMLDQLE